MKTFITLLATFFVGHLFSQATLPTYCTDFSGGLPGGWTQSGTGTQPTHDECSGRAKRFNAVGNSLTINFTGPATNIRYSISRNNPDNKTLIIEESPDGITWTAVFTHTTGNTPIPAAIHTRALLATSNYVRFRMTVRVGGRMEIDMVNVYNTTPNPAGDCKLLNLNCLDAKPICSDATFSGNNNDFGAQELNGSNSGCLSTENQSSWFYFEPQATGTMEFLIGAGTGVDYDFAIWTGTCASLGTPVRCSYAASTVPTGLSSSAVDNSEGAGGDAIVAPLGLSLGQTYILLIDNFTANSTPFTIDFTLSGGASLDCTPTPLAIRLINFDGKVADTKNVIYWSVINNFDNDFYTLERSKNGQEFEAIATVKDTDNSDSIKKYMEFDNKPYTGITYYRLKQTSFDGKFTYSQLIAIDRGTAEINVSELFPNPANESVSFAISSTKEGDLTTEIYDFSGRMIVSNNYQIHKGENSFNIQLKELEEGNYLVILKSTLFEHSQFKQLIKY